MISATSEFKNQQLASDKTAEYFKPEPFLYSKNNSPEGKVKSAIEGIENKLKGLLFLKEQHEDPVVILKEPEPMKENYKLLQQWEGVILEVHEDYFITRLHDMSNNNPDEEAEIAFDEISNQDMYLVKPGAYFYWSIGRHEARSGQQTKSSLIIFRRLPAWSKNEIERSRKRSEEICTELGWGMNAPDTKERSEGK